MLEIKFRAKSLNDQWVYGNLIKMDRTGSQSFIFPFHESASSMSCGQVIAYNMIPIDVKTVGQFVGQYDKNGTEIYEGDIIESIGYIKPYLQDIKYNEKLGGYYINFCYTEHIEYVGVGEKTKFIKVIGNIHDNPELVEETL